MLVLGVLSMAASFGVHYYVPLKPKPKPLKPKPKPVGAWGVNHGRELWCVLLRARGRAAR
jgi:hypothetical protein